MIVNRNFLILSTALLFIGAGAFGYYQWNKPHQDLTEQAADFTLSSEELYQEFVRDEQQANQDYLGKVVEITGTVGNIKEEEGNRAIILLEVPGEMFGINCAFEADQSGSLSSVEPGQSLTIRGKVDGFTLDVILSRCVRID